MGRTSTSVILVSAPPAPSAPPPHKWGGQILQSYLVSAPPARSAPPPHKWGGQVLRSYLVSAPPAPSAPPPHKWGGQVLRSYWCRPLRRLRRHLPINGEDKYFGHIGVGPSGAFGATSP